MKHIPLYDRTISKKHDSLLEIKPISANNPFLKSPHLHRHSFYELIYIRSGKGSHIIDFKSYSLFKQQWFFISPGQIHMLSGNNIDGTYLTFNESFIESLNPSLRLRTFPFFNGLQNNPCLPILSIKDIRHQIIDTYLLDQSQTYYDQNSNNTPILHAILVYLLYYLQDIYLSRYSRAIKTVSNGHVDDFFCLLKRGPRLYRFVKEYAKQLNLSPHYLNSLIVQESGQSAKFWIQKELILVSKRYLAHTSSTVNQIALTLGFETSSQFSRFFLAHTNERPLEFRKHSNRLF